MTTYVVVVTGLSVSPLIWWSIRSRHHEYWIAGACLAVVVAVLAAALFPGTTASARSAHCSAGRATATASCEPASQPTIAPPNTRQQSAAPSVNQAAPTPPTTQLRPAPPAIASSTQHGPARTVVSLSRASNPVYAGDFPDPFVVPVGDGFYAYATNIPGENVPVRFSRDLIHWNQVGDALPQLASWSIQSRFLTWAPSVIAIGDGYRMYVTVGDATRDMECIGVASSPIAAGPFTLDPRGPLVCGQTGAIDASPFRAPDGSLLLIWKHERVGSQSPRIVSQALSADGRTLIGAPTTLLVPTLAWEHGNVEGPSMLYAGGEYLLFYAAGNWNTAGYTTGIAHCTSPAGPCAKQGTPFLATSKDAVGPGGLMVFSAGSGDAYVAYHSWVGGVGYPRGVRALNIRALSIGGS